MKRSRPILLYVLAALSAVYIFFNIYQEMVYLTEKEYFTGTEYFEKQAETMQDLDPEDPDDKITLERKELEIQMRNIDNENYTRNHSTFLFMYTVGLIAIILMYLLNIKGLGLYVFYVLMEISNRYFIYGEIEGFISNYVVLNLILSLAFIGGYYSIFYKLKKQNSNA